MSAKRAAEAAPDRQPCFLGPCGCTTGAWTACSPAGTIGRCYGTSGLEPQKISPNTARRAARGGPSERVDENRAIARRKAGRPASMWEVHLATKERAFDKLAPMRRACLPATAPTTSSWPCSPPFDYAEPTITTGTLCQGRTPLLGIIRSA